MPRRQAPYSLKKRTGYWYVKFRGETAYHSTGIQINNEQTSRKHAERYAAQRVGISVSARSYRTLSDYAERYFVPGTCPWFARQHGRNNKVQEHYRDQHRARLTQHILPKFGHLPLDEVGSVAIESWLFSLDYSSQWKKHIYQTFMIVLSDLKRERLIDFDPSEIAPIVVEHVETRIPTNHESSLLFPEDIQLFRDRWNMVETSEQRDSRSGYHAPKGSRFLLGAACALAYSVGMRTSEMRALSPLAIKWDLGGIMVVETINRDGNRWAPKRDSVRVVPVPAWTMSILRHILRDRPGATYVFPGHNDGDPLELSSLGHALTALCDSLGLNHLTPHGLRHGYNTRMRSLLAGTGFAPYFDEVKGFRVSQKATDDILRSFTGHRSAEMTNLYDHPELLSQLDFFNKHFRTVIDGFWDFRKGGIH